MDRIEQVVQRAERGELTKVELAGLLPPARRRAFLEACASIERAATASCAGSGATCLASGCSVDPDAGESCLQPTLAAGEDYLKACAAEWRKLATAV